MKETKIQCFNFKEDFLIQELEDKSYDLSKFSLEEVSFLYLENDNDENRLLLRRFLNNSERNNHIILVSKHETPAFLGWKANLMAFLSIDDEQGFNQGWLNVMDRIKKYPPELNIAKEKLKINFKGGFDLVTLTDICFLAGSGSYTDIYLQNGTKKCVSYPLNILEDRIKNIGYLSRIGKSFIINLNRVKSVKQENLTFKGIKEINLKLGSTYIKRIKQNLLWY